MVTIRSQRHWRQQVVSAAVAVVVALALVLALMALTNVGQPSRPAHPVAPPSHSVQHTHPTTADGDTPTPDTYCGGGVGTHC